MGNTGGQAMDGLTLGTRYAGDIPWHGHVAAALVYVGTLALPSMPLAQLQQITNYLRAVFAI